MNVAHQLQKIRIFFADNGFVTVLEEMAASFMTLVEGHSISCHETAHDLTERGWPCAQKEMEMVGDQRPCVALRLSLFQDNGQTIQKGFSVLVVPEDFTAFNSPGHYMLQKAEGIKSCLARHDYLDRINPQITRISQK